MPPRPLLESWRFPKQVFVKMPLAHVFDVNNETVRVRAEYPQGTVVYEGVLKRRQPVTDDWMGVGYYHRQHHTVYDSGDAVPMADADRLDPRRPPSARLFVVTNNADCKHLVDECVLELPFLESGPKEFFFEHTFKRTEPHGVGDVVLSATGTL